MKLLAIFAATIPLTLFGQEQRFFTRHFQNVTDQKTENIRNYTFGNERVTITDLSGDTIVHKMVIHGISNSISKVNEFAWYGTQRGEELNYKDYFKDLSGDLEFYEKGKIRAHVIMRDKEYKYAQVWNPEGHEILENGNGTNSYLADDN